MAAPRLYVPDFVADAATVELPAGEAHHVTHVLRLKTGAAVRIFNGRGLEWSAHLSSVTRKSVEVAIDGEVTAVPEPAVHVTLAAGILKGDHMDAVVRDATMMGAAEIVPLITEHVTVPAKAWQGAAALERWHRVAVASAKQCGRAVVPTITTPKGLDVVLTEPQTTAKFMFVEPSTGIDAISLGASPTALVSPVLLLIGPEGGWSPAEIERAGRAACSFVHLGPRTIRADAMAVAGLSALWATNGSY